MNIEKDKNGFTLTEILGVLVILGLLLLLIVPSILNKVRVNEKEIKKTQENMVENSTNIYMDQDKDTYPNTEGNVYCIAIQTLIDNGKVNENLKDATSKDLDFKKKSVEVTIGKNGNRSFKVVNACNEIKYKNITFEVGPKDNSQWTQYKYVKITYPNMGEIYANEYSIDNGRTWKAVVGDTKITENFNANGKVMARMRGRTIIKGEYPVKRIDRTAPIITGVSGAPASWTNNNITLTVNGAKDTESGLNVSAYSFDGGLTWQTSNSKTYSANLNNIIIKVRDALGNTYTHPSINITKIDKTKPSCNWSGESTTWTKQQRTIIVKGTDGQSGINTGFQAKTWTYSTTTKTASLAYTIKDNAGNEQVCSKTANIYVDTIKPSCSWSGESTSWTKNSRTITVTGTDSNSGMNGNYRSKSWPYNSTKKTQSLSYIIKDNAGNEQTCSKTANIYVDKTPPYCINSGVQQGGGSFFSRSCGAMLFTQALDSDSGIAKNGAWLKRCYGEIDGNDDNIGGWGNVCIDDNVSRFPFEQQSGNSVGGYMSGPNAGYHGLNAHYAVVNFQFKFYDRAGNSVTCGKQTIGYHFYNGNC